MVITQLFYDVPSFLKFEKDCREIGIDVPILPGMMPIQNYGSWKRMTTFCKTKCPPEMEEELEPIKDNDEAVKEWGVQYLSKMVSELWDGGVRAFHFYTLNLEKSVTKILEATNFLDHVALSKKLPWRPSVLGDRSNEDVRPIFWSNRPKSYLERTQEWDEFPNGRWGSSDSPAFGDNVTYQLGHFKAKTEDLLEMWGEPKSEAEVAELFVKYIQGKLQRLPWNDHELAPESGMIDSTLVEINQKGFLSTNSQPQVNGFPSDDNVVGWGGAGGYVYQKSYMEFFCSRQRFEQLQKVIDQFPSITYLAIDSEGNTHSNHTTGEAIAVTWGVFPSRQVVQPTVVEENSFAVWSEESYNVWKWWAELYDEGSESRKVLDEIRKTYVLVCLIENDYVKGDINAIFNAIDSTDDSQGSSSTQSNL
eukprot:TRINITY_DN3303_c0_g1_i3.p1 TRINITY_DN3303_c0_g1~~TRINITY_DN3303_c0_g1_i3.p1  ORF type:complete len:420 (+),score=142.37 TRINITY_DN3303_c0_g1_i3:230-1489(+)